MLSRWILAAGTVLSLSACQSGTTDKPEDMPVTAGYRADISRICNVLHESGADEHPEGERMYITAQWLGDNLETQEGRDFLVTFQQAQDKIATLEAEAQRTQVKHCPLVKLWRDQAVDAAKAAKAAAKATETQP